MRTVFLLDFDNIFTGLARLDLEAAREWAQRPEVWVKALRTNFLAERPRRFLSLRCYMNPSGGFGAPPDRLYFHKFRPYFVAAGFEVVDCPPLTKYAKNAADIRMVIDALDGLASSTRYDEFVIASGDSDFTPLLQRLRAHDRRTTLVSSGDAVPALRAVADVYVDDQQLLGLLDPASRAVAPAPQSANGADLEARFRQGVTAELAASPKAVNLARLSAKLQRELGLDLAEKGWPGGPGFTQAIRALALPGVEIGTHEIYDTARHDPPPAAEGAESPVMERISQVLGFPRISSDLWPAVFEVLAEYAATHEFSLSESTKWSRDRLAARGAELGRQALGHVVRGSVIGGADLRDRPSAREIGEAVLRGSVLDRAEGVGLELSEDDVAEIRRWLGLDGLRADREPPAAP